MAAVIIVLIILLVAAIVGGVTWNGSRRSGLPGQGKPPLPPPGQWQQGFMQQPREPGDPGFTPWPRSTGGSFKEISRTKPSKPTTSSSPPPVVNSKPTGLGPITTNLTAICRLTGRKVADCSCARCTLLKKKV